MSTRTASQRDIPVRSAQLTVTENSKSCTMWPHSMYFPLTCTNTIILVHYIYTYEPTIMCLVPLPLECDKQLRAVFTKCGGSEIKIFFFYHHRHMDW